MAWQCKSCGQESDSVRPGAISDRWQCPNCGAETALHSTEVPPPASSSGDTVSTSHHQNADTVFQPGLMMESIMDELHEAHHGPEEAASLEPGTETVGTDPKSLQSPDLQLDTEAYLLILGAAPGQERRALTRAKTSFGRRGADWELDDPAISSMHFQIEAFGKEFFLRDLESRNGTFLNGNRVRYSQLLAGDQITAGKTSLIFRTSDDEIGRG